ncbi:MAG: hypothetical protein IH918_10455, partial [Acidobacteria bacterium]|nr:hypothetical protein [Acidobacteriota bacterium]
MTERDDIIRESHETDVPSAFEGDVPVGGRTPAAIREFGGKYLPALFSFLVVILLWEGLTRLFGIETFVLPKPSEIISSFVETWDVVWGAGFKTLSEALGGFVIGVSLVFDIFDSAINSTLVFQNLSGTASTPTYSFSLDSDTGMYKAGTNT